MSIWKLAVLSTVLGIAAVSVASAQEIIELPADPPRVELWKMQKLWEIETEDPEAPLIGTVASVVYDAASNIYILDPQLKHVLRYSADGRFLNTLGGPGEGPGEVENPFDLVLFSDGTIGMVQSFPRKIAHLNPDGTVAKTIPTDNAVGIFRSVKERNDVTVIASQTMDPKQSVKGVSVYVHEIGRELPGNEDRITFLSKTVSTRISPPTFNEYDAYFPARSWDLKENGDILLVPERDEYLVECYTPNGDLVASIERPFKLLRRTGAELEALKESRVFTFGAKRIHPETTLAPTEPAIENIRVASDGSYWITSNESEDLPVGVFASFDVFESDWRWRAKVHLEFEANLETDRLFPLEEGRFLLVKNAKSTAPGEAEGNDEDEEILEIYCITRNGS